MRCSSQHAVDIEEDEEDQEIEGLDLRDAAKGTKMAPEQAAGAAASSAGAKSEKKDPRLDMLDWPESLPYECETLDEFDDRVDQVVRRLVDCVTTRE